jgi:hypothetical protein
VEESKEEVVLIRVGDNSDKLKKRSALEVDNNKEMKEDEAILIRVEDNPNIKKRPLGWRFI